MPVELIVNGQVVEMREIDADGSIKDLQFEYTPKASSWVALRIFAARIRTPCSSKWTTSRSAPAAVARMVPRRGRRLLEAKAAQTREAEHAAAAAAYEVARQAYRKALAEAVAE